MPSATDKLKRRYYITPENLGELQKRAPSVPGGKRVELPLNSALQRYYALLESTLRRVWSAIPEPSDRAFVRHVLMGVATDDLTTSENPIAYLQEIEEAMEEYEGERPFTPSLRIAMQGFGPVEAMALVDWIEQEKAKR